MYICDECVQLCHETIAERSKAELEQERSRAEAELERLRAELDLALASRTDLERVIWLAQHGDLNRVSIIARHFARACQDAPDVPSAFVERARSLAADLEALVRK